MTYKSDGGPAFPRDELRQGEVYDQHAGMTLRQYYAAHSPITLADARGAVREVNGQAFVPCGDELLKMLAHMRLAYADAMIAEAQP